MSAFTGAAFLARHSEGMSIPSTSPPDEVGLGRCTRSRTSGCSIAHRQRVVTPEDLGERQPWPAWGGQGWVGFAGRLDGRASLARALDLDHADGLPDGLLACRAVERWGEEAPRRLLGDFSLAAWHDGERRLMLAGDPLGMRTVYYCQQGDLVLFSTTLRGLLALPQVSRAIDEHFVVDYLTLNVGDTDATFYREIRRVVPGTSLVMTPEQSRTVTCHRFDPEHRIRLKDDRAYVEAARELLDQAVRDRMRAVGPVPISASGGLDSVCVAVSARAQGQPVTLLTAVPDPSVPAFQARSGYADERVLVEALVGALPGLSAEFHPPPPDTDWNPDSLALVTAGGTPYRGSAHFSWFEGVSRRAVALGAGSVLTGQLGNLTLTWDGLLSLPALARQGQWLRLARELVLGSGGHPRRLAGLIKRNLIRPGRGARYRSDDLMAFSPVRPDILEEFKVSERLRQQGNDPGFTFPGNSRQVRIHKIIRNRCFWRADILSATRSLHGLNFTGPLTDVRLITFCLAIPEDQYLRDGTTRFLARRLLRAAGVPPAVTDNPRRGPQHPEWFAHLTQVRPSLPAQIERLRRSPTARRLIDLERLDHLLAHWPADAAAAQPQRLTYNSLLNSALNIGTFLAWVEKTN